MGAEASNESVDKPGESLEPAERAPRPRKIDNIGELLAATPPDVVCLLVNWGKNIKKSGVKPLTLGFLDKNRSMLGRWRLQKQDCLHAGPAGLKRRQFRRA